MVYPGCKSRPNILAMLKNVSLTLIDYHHSVGYVNPLQPNTIPVGGLSLKHATQLPRVSIIIGYTWFFFKKYDKFFLVIRCK